MFDHRNKLNAGVVVGVGAAFKFLSGQVNRAPPWIGNNGLEWLWRLAHEPRRYGGVSLWMDRDIFCL